MGELWAKNLWDWAVAAYSRPGVAELCLEAQDGYGQCVPLLLWAAWPGADTDRAGEAVSLARAWAEVIGPLRAVRRRLKRLVSDGDDALRLPLRENVKAVELSAEKALLDLLGGLRGGGQASGADSLAAVAAAWGHAPPPEKLAALASALSEG